jgi:hypothetical protein
MTRLSLILSFLSGALCGGLMHFGAAPMPAPVVRVEAPAPPRAPEPSAPTLETQFAASVDRTPMVRNLFAFLEPPPVAQRVVVEPLQPPQLPVAPVAAHLAIEPPPFPYRFIGTFGPRENQLAVFARDGEVINVRAGDAIGERFRLRRIGIESVDLEWGGPEALRVPLRSAGDRSPALH